MTQEEGARYDKAMVENMTQFLQIAGLAEPKLAGTKGDPTIENGPVTGNQKLAPTEILADGTKVRFADFMGNSKAGPGGEDYTDPVARVQVLAPGATEPASVDVRPASATAAVTASGLQAVLTDFEKVGASHTLSVQYDPGAWIFYIGSVLLSGSKESWRKWTLPAWKPRFMTFQRRNPMQA